ncbi:MAG: ATP-binding cassette domain-containing protein [Alphaproteobacteria bacterium]|nr:ATP-binding cassette domain-containing protein [Alphaproteobacteria bacterium]
MSDKPAPNAWLKEIVRGLRPAFREVAAISLFVNLLALSVPVFVLQVYDRVVFFQGLATLKGLAIGMAFAITFDFLLRQARSRLLQRVALRMDVLVGQILFDKLVSVPLRVLETRPMAYWQALFRDVDTVRNVFSGATAILLFDIPFAIIFVSFVFIIALPIAWVLLALIPVFVLVAWRSATVLGKAQENERQATFNRDGFIAEVIAGRATVKALALDRALRPAWEDRHAGTIQRAMHRGGRADSYLNLGISLAVFTTVIITVVGALAIIDQRLSIGALIATNMLSMRIVQPFQQLVGTWRAYAQARHAIGRLSEAFRHPEDRRESAVQLEKPKGELVLDNVSFRYGPDLAPAVDGIRLKLPARGLHAIVGRNGSGKTTMLKLLQGLYASDQGRVLLDGADIAQFSRAELVRWIGYVPQETVLFAGTVRDNIALRQPDATDEDVIAAAKKAGVHGYILDLPDGYGAEIGEAGARLSSGIRQRIIIARALVGDPPVLMLDEPTSHLDRQSEESLAETLATLAGNHTVLLVTHSPALLRAASDIVVMEAGRITMGGPTKDILPRLFPGAGPRPKVVHQS